jgi:sec-independent protein translocase protein TatC
MRNFARGVWRVLGFPFRLLWWLLTLPVRAGRGAYTFMTAESPERPLMDVFTDLAQDAKVRALFWDQVDALRMHLLRAVLGLALAATMAFLFAEQVLEFLAKPIGGLGNLQALGITEPVGIFMQVSLLSGFALSLPYIAFEFWLFAAPGLKPRERIFGLIAIPLATLLFLSGIAFTYFVFLPPALQFLQHFLAIPLEHPQAKLYFGFVTNLMLWIGISFEFPLVIYALTAVGLIRPQVLAQQWRLAIVIIAILAAAITPTVDPFSMGLVMIPMIALYFLSIGLSFVAYAGRGRSARPSEEKA